MLQIILDADPRLQAERLVQWLSEGRTDPLVPDTLIVADLGSGMWLRQQIARTAGISANVVLQLPSRFVWASVQAVLHGRQNQAPYDPLAARWAIHRILEAADEHDADRPDLEPILLAWRQAGARERVIMATELAVQFERYLAYRRHWLDQWTRSQRPAQAIARARANPGVALDGAMRHEPWQAWLWQQLLGHISGFSEQHPFDELAARLAAGADLPARRGRVALFGQLNLSSEQLAMLARLAMAQPSIWFAHDPSQGFWETLLSPAQAARMLAQSPDEAWLYEHEPAVLGEWGRQCRDSLAQMRTLEQDALAIINDDDLRNRSAPEAHGNLQRLQRAVYELNDEVWREQGPINADASLEIHATHGLARQVDVACDRVLAAFDELPDLQPDEIAIFCTDLDRAAPLVRSVFGHPQVALPVQVSGASARISATVRALEGFFSLVSGPAHVSAVLAWFEGPAQRAGVGLDAASVDGLRELLLAAGVHRDDAVSAEGEATGAVDPADVHGLRRGIDRLMLGALMGDCTDTDAVDLGVEPVGQASMAQVEALGRVVRLLDLIAQWRGTADQLRPFSDWIRLAQRFVDEWLVAPRSIASGDLLVVRDAFSALSGALASLDDGLQMPVPFATFAEALGQHLEQGSPVARASGAITVVPAGALREVPFRVCVLLGFDEGSFPRRRPRNEHDLVALLPTFGDADPVATSRGWFLRVLLNTSERLIMTYQGRHLRNNSVLNPARPLAELLDYLRRFTWADKQDIVHEHALQPFSPRRFGPDAPAPSYARQWFEAARALVAEPDPAKAPGPLAAPGVAASPGKTASAFWRTEDIVRALNDPAHAFLQHGGSMALQYDERELVDLEPLGLEDFAPWDLFDWQCRCLQWLAAGDTETQIAARLALSPQMPAGAALDPVLRKITGEAQRLQQLALNELKILGVEAADAQVLLAGGQPLETHRVAVTMADGPCVVSGALGACGPIAEQVGGGIVQWLEPVRDLSMDVVLQAGLAHLLLCSRTPAATPVVTIRLVPGVNRASQKPSIIFNRQSLLIYDGLSESIEPPWPSIVGAAHKARSQPMAWFPRTAASWLNEASAGEPLDDPSAATRAWQKAMERFAGTAWRPAGAELARKWVAALWRDQPPDLEQALRQSLPLYAPIWWAMRLSQEAL